MQGMQDSSEWNETKNHSEWNEIKMRSKYKYYEYKDFHNIQKIGNGSFGKVYRTNWKDLEEYFALKSLLNLENDAVKEIVHEVIL